MARYFLHLILLLVALFISTACETPSLIALTSVKTRAYYPHIHLAGRLSLQYQKNERQEAIHVHFDWLQKEGNTVVTLTTITGQTLAKLFFDDVAAQLQQPHHITQFAPSPAALLNEVLGYPIPIERLSFWLQGWIDKQTPYNLDTNHPNSNHSFIADEWHVQYVTWQKDTSLLNDRPKRIDFTRSTKEWGNITLRILISTWEPLS